MNKLKTTLATLTTLAALSLSHSQDKYSQIEQADFNGDGSQDILYVAATKQSIGFYYGESKFLVGNVKNKKNYKLRCLVTDYNQDNNIDVIVIQEKTNENKLIAEPKRIITYFLNEGNGKFLTKDQ